MKRIAAPMVGGMVTSTVLTLMVIPAMYALWRGREAEASADGGVGTRVGVQPTRRPVMGFGTAASSSRLRGSPRGRLG